MTDTGFPKQRVDPWLEHEARLKRLEERQSEARRWIAALRGQVRQLRETVGLPAEEEGP